jgi:hypothetical protein
VDIKTQPHFSVASHFVYSGLKYNVLAFPLATIKSSDLWDGFVASKIFVTGLNKILYQFFSKCSKHLRITQNTVWQNLNF